MIFTIEERRQGDNIWRQAGTEIALTAARAILKARRRLRCKRTTQVRALAGGASLRELEARFRSIGPKRISTSKPRANLGKLGEVADGWKNGYPPGI